MRTWLEACTPAASRRTHLLLAACMWSAVGLMLLFFGTRWLVDQAWELVLLPVALAAGAAKSHFVLDRAARRNVERILGRGDGRCVFGFLSLKSWALVAVMMVAGRLLRGSHLSRTLLGLLYAAIGTALLLSSRHVWRSRRELGRDGRE
jgi:hypothetical protein